MPIKRITISVPASVAARIKRAAGESSVSAWVTDVIEEHLEDAELEHLWQQYYRDVAPEKQDARQADALFQRLTKARSRRSAA